ncbi:nucleotidyltransferase domain-containing protein [Clostridium butyricum]|uniref:DNA polymerase beta n=1 Tax=Clostridium butyricum TaxID=1492 RepID=A0A2S7F516_CLOBU|nr:nucleotidyltransferase domain-containing protein [Clostridium butyricum]KHD16350.1 DNA polymerase beta [Clostridium butyricum]PPV11973.1 DNA polymerase beta [Clostridium butyricum]
MKYDVDYILDEKLRLEIGMLNNFISEILKESKIYLFGSIAKGNYNKNSDIDLLVLIEDDKSLKELREMRHFVEDSVEELNLNHNVDIKLYSKERYFSLASDPSFEGGIMKDLIDLGGWNYGK